MRTRTVIAILGGIALVGMAGVVWELTHRREPTYVDRVATQRLIADGLQPPGPNAREHWMAALACLENLDVDAAFSWSYAFVAGGDTYMDRTDVDAAIETALARGILEDAQRAAACPRLDLEWFPDDWFIDPMPGYTDWNDLVGFFVASARRSWEMGENDRALRATAAGMALVGHLGHQGSQWLDTIAARALEACCAVAATTARQRALPADTLEQLWSLLEDPLPAEAERLPARREWAHAELEAMHDEHGVLVPDQVVLAFRQFQAGVDGPSMAIARARAWLAPRFAESWASYRAWLEDPARLRTPLADRVDGFSGYGVELEVDTFITDTATYMARTVEVQEAALEESRGSAAGERLVVAIELHLARTGRLPRTLDELGVRAVLNPNTRAPFHYVIDGDDYTLMADELGTREYGDPALNR